MIDIVVKIEEEVLGRLRSALSLGKAMLQTKGGKETNL